MEQQIEEAKGAQTLTNHLTAELVGGAVEIRGNKARVRLPNKSGPHTFKFQLTDRTNPPLHVVFSGFGAELGETCPSAAGDNTGQIIDLEIEDRKAEFTDENTGDACTFGYAWFFSCDDKTSNADVRPHHR